MKAPRFTAFDLWLDLDWAELLEICLAQEDELDLVELARKLEELLDLGSTEMLDSWLVWGWE